MQHQAHFETHNAPVAPLDAVGEAGAIQSMATGLTHGVKRGYWSIVGLEVGLMLQLTLVAVGLGA
ncbi:hypothetical protein C6A85_16045, partial [Mycobacterium sp. ITM-2017-0098]